MRGRKSRGVGWESEDFFIFRMNNKENVYICNTGLAVKGTKWFWGMDKIVTGKLNFFKQNNNKMKNHTNTTLLRDEQLKLNERT